MIKERINNLVYELTLPEGIRIHPRFYMSFLEPIPTTIKLDTYTETENNTIKYKIEAILDHRGNIEEEKYLVKWKGYNTTENI